MNDKCAAGTGRFLEMMARSLEISIDELGPVSLQSKENIEISSMWELAKAIAGKAVSLLKRVSV